MLLNDRQIKALAKQGMISPFVPEKVRKIDGFPAVSFGTSSYGYDLRLSPDDFRIFHHVPGLVIDPKNFDDRCLQPAPKYGGGSDRYFILPSHTYALGVLDEYLNIPKDVTVIFIGKSTYARCGIIINTTPGEAGWEGHLTLEISNSSGADCKIYANEGICQALFFQGEPCEQPYGNGKYQYQSASVTLARV